MRRSLEDLIANSDAIADSFEAYEPQPEDFDAPLPPLMVVKLAAFRRGQAEKELAEAIAKAREANLSWRELGEAIGTSGEAVRQRYAGHAVLMRGQQAEVEQRVAELKANPELGLTIDETVAAARKLLGRPPA